MAEPTSRAFSRTALLLLAEERWSDQGYPAINPGNEGCLTDTQRKADPAGTTGRKARTVQIPKLTVRGRSATHS
jgi:hypothetical protein